MNQNVERNTFKTANVTVGVLLVIFSLLISFGFFAATFFSNGISSLLFGAIAFGFIGLTLSSLFSFNIVEPKEIRVVQLFGKRKGTFEGEGIHWVLPWYSTTKHSLADFKMESPLIKVNDGRGTPIKTSITATCRIVDAEKFEYDLEQSLGEYLETTIQGCLRNIVKQYPYDSSKDNELTLTQNSDEISDIIETTINKETSKYGIQIDSVAFSELNYAPEIAAAMLQKQQAMAAVDAKKVLTEGLVDVVEGVCEKLGQSERVKFDKDQLAKLSSQLLVVMAGSENPAPVISLND
tara:strand:+ start:1427 stop:2308 length:882 start_codon:yes stop_codon:yes gene_type:complete